MKPKSNPPQPEKSDVTIFGIYLLHGNLKPLRFRRSAGVSCFDISDWKRCRMKHNESPTLFVRGHYPFLLLRYLVFYQLLFIALSLYFCSDKHLKSDGLILISNHIQKNVVLNICLFDVLAYHSHRDKQTE